jgi:glycoside/pentoside/hexuronide:cation symporter, GPH family
MSIAQRPDSAPDLLRYGLLGLPLAFVALPLVVQWPAHAASQWGLPLAALGTMLVAVRVLDALVDPWIGRRADGWFAASPALPWRALGVAAALLCAGFFALFFVPSAVLEPRAESGALMLWATAALVLTYLGYSLAQVVHQAWAARLGGNELQRSRWVGAREACALVGVLVASVLPTLAGWAVTGWTLAGLLLVGLWALHGFRQAPVAAVLTEASQRPGAAPSPAPAKAQASPWASPSFRSLLLVYTLNGLAASIPASLVLFFIRDRIQAPATFEALALAAYFAAAAAAVPLWVRAVARKGLVVTWMWGMALSIAAFMGAAVLGAGDEVAYLLICVTSGAALGADLVVPPALLAGVIQRTGAQGQAEGRWFGWWSMATKLTLALAAGIALPLVQVLGYQPGAREPQALAALGLVYALLPCLIKALALAGVWRYRNEWGAT